MLKHTFLAAVAALMLSFGSVYAADKIDLNNASNEELQMIDGVGPATAEAVVEYREANGGFESMDEVQNVNGIGEKKATQLSEQATISQ